MNISTDRALKLFLLLCLFLPQFPPVFQRTEFHIHIFALICACLSLILFKLKLNHLEKTLLFSYFVVFQFLLFLSYALGVEGLNGFSDIPSYTRPTMLLIITLGFATLIKNMVVTYDSILSIAKLLICIVFIYSLCEVFLFDVFSGLMHLTYRLEDKININGIAVSFFTLPYYASYILLVFLPILLSNYKLNKSYTSLCYIFIAFISITLTQSKMGIFLSFGVLFLYWFLSVSLYKKLLVLIIFSIFFGLLIIYLVDFVTYLIDNYGGNFAKTLHLILTNPEYAYNLTERLDDITETFTLITSNNYFVGVGLGKSITIEIWIAIILYRYGFIGLIFFIIYFLIIGCWAAKKSTQDYIYHEKYRELLKMVAIWALIIFLTQLSDLMIEKSKAAIVSCFMFALAAKVLAYQERKSDKIVSSRSSQ